MRGWVAASGGRSRDTCDSFAQDGAWSPCGNAVGVCWMKMRWTVRCEVRGAVAASRPFT